jgi:hypothetical protein
MINNAKLLISQKHNLALLSIFIDAMALLIGKNHKRQPNLLLSKKPPIDA